MLISKFCDIPYRSGGDPCHTLDITYPRNTEKTLPVIVDIHGGGWSFGDKSLNRNYCSALARQGFSVVNINYRQLPDAALKEQIKDIFAALHALPLLAQEHPLDLSTVFLCGDSAGGQLALLCTAIACKPQLQKQYQTGSLPFSITALGLSAPVPYIEDAAEVEGYEKTPAMLIQGLGRSAWAVEDILSDCCLPPVCIITAEDDIRWHRQSSKLADTLEKLALPYMYAPFKPEEEPLEHVFNVKLPHSPKGKQANALMTDFFLSLIK